MMSFKKFEMATLMLTAIVLALFLVPVTASASSYEFVTAWGSEGTGDGQLNSPYGLTVDNNTGYIYVTDTWNDRIQKFTSGGTFVSKWGAEGSGDKQFILPSDIVINSSGYIYVLDTCNHRVQQFKPDTEFVREWGGYGDNESEFYYPDCIAINLTSGHIYVSDSFNNRIQKFTSDGSFVTKWGSYGTGATQFSTPEGIAVDQISGNVFVVDNNNYRVLKFSSDGTYLSAWGSEGTGDGEFGEPYGITVDNSGYVYVTDTERNNVQKFTSDGTFVTKWGSYGTGNGYFSYPFGIDVDNSGYVYVTDSSNHRIQKFQWVPSSPVTPDSDGDGGSSTAVAVGSNIKAGESVVLNLKKGSNTALTTMIVTVDKYVSSILVTAEKTTAGRYGVEACEDDTYQYIKVDSYHVTADQIEQVVLEFTVSKSWLDENGYGIGDIAMMHYNDDEKEWEQLPTEFVREEGGIVYYSAVSPSLSYFAISYVEDAIVIPEETPVTQAPTATRTVSPTPVPTYVPRETPTAVPTEAQPAPGFTAFGVLAGLAAAFIVLKRR